MEYAATNQDAGGSVAATPKPALHSRLDATPFDPGIGREAAQRSRPGNPPSDPNNARPPGRTGLSIKLCLAFGAAWLAGLFGLEKAIAFGVTPFLLGTLLKSALGAATLALLVRGKARSTQ